MKKAGILYFGFLCAALYLTACSKKEKETNATIDSLKLYGDAVPVAPVIPLTTLSIYNDTLFPPAGDEGSRTFFHLSNGLVYTGQTLTEKPDLSKDIIMAYFFHNDSDTSATLTNLYTFPYHYNHWKKSTTLFRKGISEEVYKLCNSNSDLITAFHRSSKADSVYGAAYNLSKNDIIAFKTEQNKYGLIKVKNLVPGNDPYKNFLTFEMKVQKNN